MPRVKAPVVVTANCVRSGQVVYLDANTTWVTELQAAALFGCVEAAASAMLAGADEAAVIGAYLIPVTGSLGAVSPTHYREVIRLEGPGAYIANPTRGSQRVSL